MAICCDCETRAAVWTSREGRPYCHFCWRAADRKCQKCGQGPPKSAQRADGNFLCGECFTYDPLYVEKALKHIAHARENLRDWNGANKLERRLWRETFDVISTKRLTIEQIADIFKTFESYYGDTLDESMYFQRTER